MPDYPAPPVQENHVEPVPRRIRAVLAGQTVVDTTAARYVWEWPPFPQYYVPLADVAPDVLVDEQSTEDDAPGRRQALRAARGRRRTDRGRRRCSVRRRWPASTTRCVSSGRRSTPGTRRTSRSSSTRAVRTPGSTPSAPPARCGWSPTVSCWPSPPHPSCASRPGCPTRYYLNRTDVDFTHLVPHRDPDGLPLQGRHHRLLVIGDRGAHPPRHRLGLRLPDPRPAAHRRPRGLLQREARHLPRRRGARAPEAPTSPEPRPPARSVRTRLGYLVPSTGLSTSPV